MEDTEAAREKRSSGSDATVEDDGIDEPEPAGAPAGDRWPAESPVLEAELPEDVGSLLGRLLGDDAVETLGDWVDEVRRHTGGGSITVDELCHADVDSAHRGELDGETYGFRCFYDAVILAALVDEPVDVRTESPRGAVIEAYAAGTDDLQVEPAEAVFSFGVDETVDPPTDDGPTNAAAYSAVCPYVRAFPGPAAYEEWAETVPAATVAMPLSGATDVAAALVEPAGEGTNEN